MLRHPHSSRPTPGPRKKLGLGALVGVCERAAGAVQGQHQEHQASKAHQGAIPAGRAPWCSFAVFVFLVLEKADARGSALPAGFCAPAIAFFLGPGVRRDERGWSGVGEANASARPQGLGQQAALGGAAGAGAPGDDDLAGRVVGGERAHGHRARRRPGRRPPPSPAGRRRPSPEPTICTRVGSEVAANAASSRAAWRAARGRRRPARARAGSGRPPAGSGPRRSSRSAETRRSAVSGWLAGKAASSSSSATSAQASPVMS